MNSHQPRIAYVPYSPNLTSPADLRRFVAYARSRGINFEIADLKQRYDFVVLSEAADVTFWQDYTGGKVIYDLVDSYLSVSRYNIRQWLQGTVAFITGRHRNFQLDYWRSIANMCWRADAVICTTIEQKALIQLYCNNVHIILDIQTPLITKVKEQYKLETPVNLVWEGLPTNVTQLLQVKDVLSEVHNQHPLRLHIITDASYPRFMGRFGKVETLKIARKIFHDVELHAWNPETLADLVSQCDIGIIPINLSDALVTGKPENKLLLFWRMGLPVITSATPAYQRAMREIKATNLVCKSLSDWTAALHLLIEDAYARKEVGVKGRAYADQHFGQKVLFKKWDEVFASLGYPAPIEDLGKRKEARSTSLPKRK